jgi:hypothetical protein
METNQVEVCVNCTTPLPSVGFFCGGCLTQFKCKSCEELLQKDNIGCVFCGTPKEEQAKTNGKGPINNINTFRYHEIITEKSTERTIDGAYSDNVSKDFASVLISKLNGISTTANSRANRISDKPENDITNHEIFQDAEIIIKDEKNTESQNASPTLSTEYPALKAIAMKNLPSSETEWIVVYAFYASNYGEKIFDRENIINNYIESNRYNKTSTKRDLSKCMTRAVVQGFINPLQTGYSMLDTGIEKAKEIISRTSSANPKTSKRFKKTTKEEETGEEVKDKKAKKSTASTGRSLKRLTDIDFHPTGKDSLDKFYKAFTVKNDNERNLLFVYYLSETLKISTIKNDHLYTCYDELGLRIPENMQSCIYNTKTRTGWIGTNDNSNITVTVKGKNKIKFWDKKD